MSSPAYVEDGERVEDADRALVVRALEGDADAFERIVRTYQRRIYAVAVGVTRRHEVADDIVQETFVRAYKTLDRFELGRPLAPWLTRIAVNLSINYLKSSQRREHTFAEPNDDANVSVHPAHDPDAESPLRQLMAAEFSQALSEAVKRLPAEQRAVFVLKVEQELRYEEIAETLGISTGTVMSRLFRARAKLKVMLADVWPIAGPRERADTGKRDTEA